MKSVLFLTFLWPGMMVVTVKVTVISVFAKYMSTMLEVNMMFVV